MKIDENKRKSTTIVENLRKCAKMWGNLGKPCEIPRKAAKFRENLRKSARYFLTGRLFNWMVHFSLREFADTCVTLSSPVLATLRGPMIEEGNEPSS